MINRDEFSKALEEIRDLRARLAAERFMHDRLRGAIEAQAAACGKTAAKELRDNNGRVTSKWRSAADGQAALTTTLRRA